MGDARVLPTHFINLYLLERVILHCLAFDLAHLWSVLADSTLTKSFRKLTGLQALQRSLGYDFVDSLGDHME